MDGGTLGELLGGTIARRMKQELENPVNLFGCFLEMVRPSVQKDHDETANSWPPHKTLCRLCLLTRKRYRNDLQRPSGIG